MRLILLLALALPCWGAIARVAANCTGTTSCTATGSVTGDLHIALAGRNGSQTAPALPAGWTSLGTVSINGTGSADSSARMACKVATSNDEASGTFTNAGTLILMVYTGFLPGTTATCASTIMGTPSFFSTAPNTTDTTATFNAITVANSDSWVVGFGWCSACTAGIATAPTGMANRDSITGPPGEGGHDTNGTTSGFSSANVTLTTAGRIITGTVEIKAPLASRVRHVVTNGGLE